MGRGSGKSTFGGNSMATIGLCGRSGTKDLSAEVVGQDAALKERSQFFFYKPGYQAIALPLPGQEGFQDGPDKL